MKLICRLLLVLFFVSAGPADAQDMSNNRKERKRVWRRWRSKKEAYNPYLNKKAKNKPSAQISKGNKKEMKRQKRQFKRQLKRSKRKVS